MKLPEGVERSEVRKPNGKVYVYYYWNPGRGTEREGERIKLPSAEKQPRQFFAEVERRTRETPAAFAAGSVGRLVADYRASDEFLRNAESTQRNYDVHLRRFEAADVWGHLNVDDLTPLAVSTARDALKKTPVMANQMLAVGRTLFDWAIPLGRAQANPFDKVPDLEVPDRGHVPWPQWVIDFVLAKAWPDLVRVTRLGVMTCQRGSDLIRMGPDHRESNGIWCRPQKTRKRRRSFLIPLATADALELNAWAEAPMTFTASRWLAPIERFNPDLYLYSPKGAPYTADGMRARWGRWLADTADGRDLCRRWKEWVTYQVKRYDWDIDPDDADHPTLHGLRGTGILARAERGYELDQISSDIGMSPQMVARYLRFRDQMKVATDGQRRLRVIGSEG